MTMVSAKTNHSNVDVSSLGFSVGEGFESLPTISQHCHRRSASICQCFVAEILSFYYLLVYRTRVRRMRGRHWPPR